MALSLHQVQKQTQKLIMTPQMQQSIQLLQLTTMQLEQLATQEMMENPLLELIDDEEQLAVENSAAAGTIAETDSSSSQNLAAPEAAAESSGRIEAPDSAPSDDERYSFDAVSEPLDTPPSAEPASFDSVDMDWNEYFSDGENPAYSPREEEEERDFTQYTALRDTLYDHLTRQLRLSALEGEAFQIGEFLVGSLNEDGLFDCSMTALLGILGVPVEVLSSHCPRNELQRVVADLLNKKVEEIAHLDDKELYLAAMAELLQTHPAALAGKSPRELEAMLLAKRLGMDRETLAEIPPREQFLLAVAQRLGRARDAVEDALDVIQEFEPTGVGARDLSECLRLQAEARGIRNRRLYVILDDHLKLLQQKKFRELAMLLECPESEIVEIFHLVSRMEPKPGRSLTRESPRYIKPDVFVKKVDGQYLYSLNEGDTGRLKISSRYREMLTNPGANGREREYVLEKFRAAAWLIKNIEKRKSTILRVTEAIMNFQRDFIEKGIEYLRPLTLREIADVVGMHESTIARVTSGKYVETPRGIFELKYFFSSGLETQDGDETSSKSIKEKIAQLIANENPKRPLSDQKITLQLKRDGLIIARRTVAKYREQLRILPAKLRKQTP
jgi:RNA polymerase sigma-54 factor